MLKKCVICNGELKPKIVNQVYNKVTVSNVPVLECINCKEQYLNPEASRYIDEQLKINLKPELEVNIKSIRSSKGLKQEDIANKLGVSIQRYSEIERNKKTPSILLALKLADVLDCDVNELYKLKYRV